MKKSAKIQSTRPIADPAAIAALAAPVRQELVDTVEAQGGAATIAELAAQLGRPADGLYYHVRRLVAAGLLVPEPARGGRGERYRIPGKAALALAYRPRDPKNAAAVRRVVAGMLRIARRDFDAALTRPGVVTHGPRRALWASRAKGWIAADELVAINALFAQLIAFLRRGRARGRDRLVSVCWVLAPIEARPPRRGSSGGGRRRRSS